MDRAVVTCDGERERAIGKPNAHGEVDADISVPLEVGEAKFGDEVRYPLSGCRFRKAYNAIPANEMQP